MLKRDFTKSNKDYFNKNKIVLICIAVFLLIAIVIGLTFKMNGNFEFKGYNEFSVVIGEEKVKDFNKYSKNISNTLNKYDAKFDTVSIYGKGDDAKLVVRYLNDMTEAQEIEINKIIADKLSIDVNAVTEHSFVKPIVENKDYVYTAVSILLIIVIATLFAYIRYNGASALSMLLSCLLGTAGFIAIGTLLRLQIGLSYFAMLVSLNMLIVYSAINLFETMHKSSWLISDDYSNAISTALKASKFRTIVLSFALMIVGVLFVFIAPSAIKYVSLNIMFMAVVLLAVSWYVIPFVWSVFITHCKKRTYKIKAGAVEDKKDKNK